MPSESHVIFLEMMVNDINYISHTQLMGEMMMMMMIYIMMQSLLVCVCHEKSSLPTSGLSAGGAK